MSPGTRHGRRSTAFVFGLFLASGVTVGTYCLWAVADWIHPQGEKGLGLYLIGALSFVPVLLGWLAGGVHMFMASRNRDVRLGVALTTAHLMWWLLLIGIARWRDNLSSGWVVRAAAIVEPGLYAVGVTFLAARWLWWRRSHDPVQGLVCVLLLALPPVAHRQAVTAAGAAGSLALGCNQATEPRRADNTHPYYRGLAVDA
jgi:hypothetical protein